MRAYRSGTRTHGGSSRIAMGAVGLLVCVACGFAYLTAATQSESDGEPAIARAAVPETLTMSFSAPRVQGSLTSPMVKSSTVSGASDRSSSDRAARSQTRRRSRRAERVAPPSRETPVAEPSEIADSGLPIVAAEAEGAEVAPRTLSPGDIATVHRANAAMVTACHRRALRRDPFLRVGRADVDLAVAPDGAVASVRFIDFEDGELASCLVRALSSWRFPSSQLGADTRLTLVFKH